MIETPEQHDNRLNKQKMIDVRYRLKRANCKPLKHCAQSTDNVELFSLGPLNVECCKCTALHFDKENVTGKNKGSFNDCCKHGKALLNEYPELPELLKKLFEKLDPRSNNFFENIRRLNSNLSFASMNCKRFDFMKHNFCRGPWTFRVHGQIVHKTNVALMPGQGETPAFGQMYIYDTEQAMNFLKNVSPNINESLQRDLYELLKTTHPMAECYEMMKDLIDDENSTAAMEGRRPNEINLLIKSNKNLDNRVYNTPTANELALIYVPGSEGEMPEASFVIRPKGKELKILNILNANLLPMLYPFFFPFGSLGWHPAYKSLTNEKVTRLGFISAILQIRPGKFNPLLCGGKLTQQFIVDCYCMYESDKLNWIRNNQKKILAEEYKSVDDLLKKMLY